MSIHCLRRARLTVTGTGVGALTVTIDGPTHSRASGIHRVTATVSGQPGTYLARFTATGRLDRMAWTASGGDCAG